MISGIHDPVVLADQLLARIFGNRAEFVVGVGDDSFGVRDGDEGVLVESGLEIGERRVGLLQLAGALLHPLFQSGVEVADFLLRLLALDGDEHHMHRPLDQLQLGGGRVAGFPIINGEGAENSPARVLNRRGPAGVQTVLQRQLAVVRPQRISGDVLDDDLPLAVGGRATGSVRGTDGQTVDGAVVGFRQAGCRTVPHMDAVVVEQEDRQIASGSCFSKLNIKRSSTSCSGDRLPMSSSALFSQASISSASVRSVMSITMDATPATAPCSSMSGVLYHSQRIGVPSLLTFALVARSPPVFSSSALQIPSTMGRND